MPPSQAKLDRVTSASGRCLKWAGEPTIKEAQEADDGMQELDGTAGLLLRSEAWVSAGLFSVATSGFLELTELDIRFVDWSGSTLFEAAAEDVRVTFPRFLVDGLVVVLSNARRTVLFANPYGFGSVRPAREIRRSWKTVIAAWPEPSSPRPSN